MIRFRKEYMSNLSRGLQNYWRREINNGRVKAMPKSGDCILCGCKLTDYDDDHSVCNNCWPEEEV